jgi:hypothetical protein
VRGYAFPVPIVIRKVGGGYVAQVTPPHGNGSGWRTASPVDRDRLVSKLEKLGGHPNRYR